MAIHGNRCVCQNMAELWDHTNYVWESMFGGRITSAALLLFVISTLSLLPQQSISQFVEGSAPHALMLSSIASDLRIENESQFVSLRSVKFRLPVLVPCIFERQSKVVIKGASGRRIGIPKITLRPASKACFLAAWFGRCVIGP